MPQCGDCKKDFSNISNLRAHIRKKHSGKIQILAPKVRKSSSSATNVHVCKECSKTFISFGNLRFHIREKHPGKLEELAPLKVKKYKCVRCNDKFQMCKHPIEHKRFHDAPGTIHCPLCQYKSDSANTLIKHYEVEHDLEISTEKLEFDGFEAFQHWKSTMEKETFASFVKTRGTSQNSNYTKIDYKCHRSGEYRGKGKNMRRLKTQGSNKIGGFCPAKIRVIIKDNKYEVQFCGNHVGHQQENDLQHLFLTKSERDSIAAKVAAKIPKNNILNEIRDSVSNCPQERLHLLNKKDLFNIEYSFKQSESSVGYQNEAVDVDASVNTSNIEYVEVQSESSLANDIGNSDEEVETLAKSISTNNSTSQGDLQQQILQQQQEILQAFQESLLTTKTIYEINVFKRILATLKPALAAVRNR